MAHKHESHFIPSPYPTVTSYENEFVDTGKYGGFLKTLYTYC